MLNTGYKKNNISQWAILRLKINIFTYNILNKLLYISKKDGRNKKLFN